MRAACRCTPTEFRLIALLAGQPGETRRRRDLVRAAWPDGAVVHDNTLDVYVARLRRKLAQLVEAGDRHGPRRGLPTAVISLRVTGLRARLVLLAVAGSVLVLGVLIAGFNVVLDSRLRSDADNVLRERAAAQLQTLVLVDGRLHVRDAPDNAAQDTQTWIFAGVGFPWSGLEAIRGTRERHWR